MSRVSRAPVRVRRTHPRDHEESRNLFLPRFLPYGRNASATRSMDRHRKGDAVFLSVNYTLMARQMSSSTSLYRVQTRDRAFADASAAQIQMIKHARLFRAAAGATADPQRSVSDDRGSATLPNANSRFRYLQLKYLKPPSSDVADGSTSKTAIATGTMSQRKETRLDLPSRSHGGP